MSIHITEGYNPGCIGRIAQLHAAYYSVASGFGVEFEAKVARELSDFCLSYKPGRGGIWLAQNAEVEGSVIIDGSNANEGGAHLRWFITSDAVRGQGLGKQLLSKVIEFTDNCGYKSVSLWTFAGLNAARHLYESFGFKLVHESPGSRWGSIVCEQRFLRGLTPRSRRGPTAGHQARAGGTHTFSPARAWRPAVGPASTRTLGVGQNY